MTRYGVERTDWFGDCELVKDFATRAEAEAFCRICRRHSKACDDPEDRVRYRIVESTLISEPNRRI